MEDYWFDLELYFPLKILVDLKKNQDLIYQYSDFDVEWTRLWSFWELYFSKYYGRGVEIFIKNSEATNKNSWIKAIDYLKLLAKRHKLKLNTKFPKEGLIGFNSKMVTLSERRRPYELLELKFTINKKGKNYLINNLKEYFKKYLNGELKNTDESHFIIANKQIEVIKEHLQKRIDNGENPKDLWVYDEEIFSGQPLSEQDIGTYSPVDRKFRILEPFGTLFLTDFINIDEIHFYDTNKYPLQFKEGGYWFFGHISIDDDLKKWSIESIKESLGMSLSNTKIKKSDKRDYWYENSQLRFNLASGGVDQFDFSKAEVSRKLFETFYELWEGDNEGSYTIKQITGKYKDKFRLDDLDPKRIGEIVSNIRASIINPKTVIKDRLTWKYNRSNKKWIFQIHPLKH